MNSPDREFTHRMVQTVLTCAVVAVALAALWVARSALMLIYVSALIAMGFAPAVQVLQTRTSSRRGVPRTLAILVIYLAIVLLILLLGLAVVPPLIEQAGELWARAPQAFTELQRFLVRHNLMARRVTLQEAVQSAPAGSGSAVNTVLVAVWGVVGGVVGVVTILILSFYLLVEAESLVNYFTRLVPARNRDRFVTVSHEIVKKVSAWLSAQFILSGIMGGFTAIGLGLMGVPYFYVVALIAALGETIPIVGPVIAGITAVAVALTASAKLALMVGVGFLILHQFEANVLVPKVMERRVGVSPVAVIAALLIGNELFGLVGAILAIPSAAILSVIVDELTAQTPA
jgi:predicted PurR-regulated permease PerM